MHDNIKTGLKSFIELLCAILYMPVLLLRNKGPLRSVIYYHGVAAEDLARFSKQIAYLAQNCSVVQPSKIKTTDSNEAGPIVAITFDDAFTSILKNAVPILREYKLPAGIFVPTGMLGKKPSWEMPKDYPDKNEMVMHSEQIIELDKDGFEIFSHTVTHPVLTQLDDDELNQELIESQRQLQKLIGYEVSIISYPYGAHDTRVREAAKRVGYKYGFTIEPQMVDRSTDDMNIGRFKVSPKDSLLKFRFKINGGYEVVKYLSRLKKLFMRVQLADKK